MAALDPIETLRRVPFFAVLPPDELRALAAHCVVRRLRRDEMLFAEGDSCGGLFVVQAGAVKQFKMAETGREQVLVTERAGSTVGELALFDGGNFPASAAAVEDSTVLYLPKREFLDVCRHNSGVAFAVIFRNCTATGCGRGAILHLPTRRRGGQTFRWPALLMLCSCRLSRLRICIWCK